MIQFLYGSAALSFAAALIGLLFLGFEGSINGPRRRDRIAGRTIFAVFGAAAWAGAALAIGSR